MKKLVGIAGGLLFVYGVAVAEQAADTASEQSQVADSAVSTNTTSDASQAVTDTTQPLAEGSVARATFTTAVQDREPVDQVSSLDNDSSKVYFFSELKDLQGQQVIHRWSHNGEQHAEVAINVGGPRWRVWSSKALQSDWTGTWQVDVINGSGNIISTQTFEYQQAAASDSATAPVADASAADQVTTDAASQ